MEHWLVLHQVGTIISMMLLIAVFAWLARRSRHPVLLMVLASTSIVWQDPIMNWAPYAVYNPQLWHLPEDWPLVIAVAHGRAVHRDRLLDLLLSARSSRPSGSCAGCRPRGRRLVRWRRPLISLALLILLDRVRHRRDAGDLPRPHRAATSTRRSSRGARSSPETTFQFPLIWESLLVTFVMIPAGVLCYRDDTGTHAGREAGPAGALFADAPALGTFLVMFVIFNVAYFVYGAGFALIKRDEARDLRRLPLAVSGSQGLRPAGLLREEGQPGPYSEGTGTPG